MNRNSRIQKVTFQVLGTITDILLYTTYLAGASVGKTGPRGVYEAFREADQELQKCNHQTIATAWHKLLKAGLIRQVKRKGLYHPEITAIGRKLLSERIPTYLSHRTWDKKIYLITYDIAEKHHRKRDLFRFFLKKIHSRKFQESVWITPYNPRQLINEYVSEREIEGTIIVSDVGKDGGIGETTVQDLLWELYELEKLNNRYNEWIEKVKNKSATYQYLMYEYLSILKDDPQLPFELLPQNWLGDKAYKTHEEIKQKYTLLGSRPRVQ